MSQQDISSKEQQCISQCIFDHWGEQSQSPAESRDEDYQRCLSDCRICG